MWFLIWWSHALSHRLNPLITYALWAPRSFNLAWTTCIPLAGVIAIPLTRAVGPVVSYNVLCLLAPALASWTAFILCRYITRTYWPSLLGGYIFGFSSYMSGQMLGHLHLLLVFPVPLAVYLVVRRLTADIRSGTFAILLALVLVAQFLLAIEIFATMAMFGVIAIVLGISFTSGDARARLRKLVFPILGGCAIAIVLVSPYLYYLFAFGFPHGPSWPPEMYSVDLLNFIIPAPTNVLGRLAALESISGRFPGNSFEAAGYLGILLIMIAAIFARHNWREPLGKLLVDFLVIICVLSLGPFLHIAGVRSIGMPGKVFARLPILDKALPARFALYAFLDLAIITSIWLAGSGVRTRSKYVMSVLAVLFLMPNLSARLWSTPVDTPAFFSNGLYRNYLAPGETVLILPYGIRGNGMLWQAQTDMYFRMAGGWTGPVPADFESWPIVPALYGQAYLPEPDLQLKAFLANHGVSAVIVSDREKNAWRSLLSTLRVTPVDAGGVSFYKIAPAQLAAYKSLTALDMEREAASARFDALLAAANRYLQHGGTPAALAPSVAERLRLLPAGWLVGPPLPRRWGQGPEPRLDKGLWLGPWRSGEISVGLAGSYAAVKPLIDKYRGAAGQIYFPYPKLLSGTVQRDGRWLLVMVFNRAQLSRAAAEIEAPRSRPPADSEAVPFSSDASRPAVSR